MIQGTTAPPLSQAMAVPNVEINGGEVKLTVTSKRGRHNKVKKALSQKTPKSTKRRHLAFFPRLVVQIRRIRIPCQVSFTG